MSIELDFYTTKPFDLSQKKLKQIINFILRSARPQLKSAKLSLVVVGDKEIKKLNRIYRHKNKPTTVLAFPGQVKGFIDVEENDLGEVVISKDKCLELARAKKTTWRKEFLWLLTHGVLHLLGYDHHTNYQMRKMKMMEDKILSYLYKKYA